MRTGIALLCLLLMHPASALATTLRLSGDIDLLVLDGKKVSSLLLRGAESIELDNGPHQLVFRVEKTIILSDQNRQLYVSPPLIANFNSQLIGQVNFALPRLETLEETQAFTSRPHLSLLNGNAMPMPVKFDILAITQASENIDYEKATEAYNLARKQASDTRFSLPMPDDSSLLSKASELDNPAFQPQTLAEQRLKYWFQRADPATHQRFLEWAKSQPSS